jgi:hypothetical protein
MPVPKELVDKLADTENISYKEYLSIIEIINKEVDKIWVWICDFAGRDLRWWCFDQDEDGGSFDPVRHKEWISIGGEIENNSKISRDPEYPYGDGFPTSFLWGDYRWIVRTELRKIKKKRKERIKKRIEEKKRWMEKYPELVKSIRSKLTPEELSIICFRKSYEGDKQ